MNPRKWVCPESCVPGQISKIGEAIAELNGESGQGGLSVKNEYLTLQPDLAQLHVTLA
jgi:hypothetical protein